MIKINLVPQEYTERLDRKAVIAKAVLVGVVTLAMVILLSVWHFTRAKTLERSLVRLEVELKSLQGDVDKVKAIEAQIAEVQRYLNSISSITRGRFIYSHFMQDLMTNLPGTIWFGGIATTSRGETLTLNLVVNSRSAYDLAYWINILETTPKYSEVSIGGISSVAEASGKSLTTTITMKYAYK